MYWDEKDQDFESVLKGEFAGRIYSANKFVPVLEMMPENYLPIGFRNQLKGSGSLLVYFNSQEMKIFALQYYIENNRLTLEILKPSSQDWEEVRLFSYRIAEIVPDSIIKVFDELTFQAETEAA